MGKDNSDNKSNLSRREFIGRTAAGGAVLVVGPVSSLFSVNPQEVAKWPADAGKFRFHMIGHAHIDPVWLWPWSEGLSVVHSTFRSALDRMNETPDFTFVSSSAQFYEWVAENDPDMLQEIRKRVAEGRWNVVGGWWVEPDVNIPSGEALVRQGLYGQRTLQRLLGRRASVAFNPDSFGHAATLPQILRLQGMDNYIFMRPGRNEKTLPADIFWWEAPDGSRVLTYRIPISYNDNGSVRRRVEQVLDQYKNEPVNSFMAFYGAGDHGGGATKENIRSINELKVENGAPAIFYSTPERYFSEIRQQNSALFPVVHDDLQHHARGCYTAEADTKKGNRSAETALVNAEKISAIGKMAWAASYPKQDFTRAWQKVLFNQFHDSLAGTSLPEHYRSAAEGFGFALETAHNAAWMAVQKLEWQVPAEDPESQYLLLFNSNAWETSAVVEYDLNRNLSNTSRVEDENGNSQIHQWGAGTTEAGNRRTLIIKAVIPPMGYRQLRLMKGEAARCDDPVTVTMNSMENKYIRLTVGYDGAIGLYDKESGRNIFAGGERGCRALVINDKSDTWSHDITTFDEEIGSFSHARTTIIESGPLRGILRVVSVYGTSTLTTDWIVTSGSRHPEANCCVDWHEQLKMVKFSFPVALREPAISMEVPYGNISRKGNGEEEPGQRWVDLSSARAAETTGFAVINDAKYGYSVSRNDLRISVLRSAVYAHHNPRVLDMNAAHLWMDQGIKSFRLKLVPHRGTWQESGLLRITEEFFAPPVVIYQGIHGGKMSKAASFTSIDTSGVIITSIKESEEGSDLIVRCVEGHGVETEATIDFKFADRKWIGNFRPYEIKTLRMIKKSGLIREVNLLEE